MFTNIICEKIDHIYKITINREKQLNALNKDVLEELDKAIDILNNDEGIFVGIISGQGRAFVAGADINEMKDMNFEEGRKFSEEGNRVFRKIESSPKPIIAAINGFCLGGGLELAMSCDIRIASQKAKLGLVELNIGIIPGFGGTQRLPKIVGIGKAKELTYSAKIIDAKEALKINLVNTVIEEDKLMDETIKMAKDISTKGQLAVRYAKIAINQGLDMSIDNGIKLESNLFGMCFASYDQKEGMEAFLEKREANFDLKKDIK